MATDASTVTRADVLALLDELIAGHMLNRRFGGDASDDRRVAAAKVEVERLRRALRKASDQQASFWE